MLYLQRATHIAFFTVLCSLILNTQVLAIPLRGRQNNGARTLTTTNIQMTPAGPMTETCTVVLTPITDNNGNPAVEEVRVCTLRLEPTVTSAASSISSTSTASASTTAQSSASTSSSIITSAGSGSTISLPSSTITASSSVSSEVAVSNTFSGSISSAAVTTSAASVSNTFSGSISSAAVTTSAASVSNTSSGSISSAAVTTSAASVSRPISVIGVSSVTVSASITTGSTPASITSPASASITSPVSGSVSSTISNTVSSTSVNTDNQTPRSSQGATASNDSTPTTSNVPSSTSTDSNGTAAAAESSADAGFSMPGKKLSVLPIGLGVFAGISVIALIVVGLVTYERTKYRKAFRQQKLAEAGASMGYGGMAR